MTNSAEQIVLIGQMQSRLEEASARGFKDNPKALNIVSEMKDALDLLEELAHREFSPPKVAAISVRRFANKDGFSDDTDYIQVEPNGDAYIVRKNGLSTPSVAYCLRSCLSNVAVGAWIELGVA